MSVTPPQTRPTPTSPSSAPPSSASPSSASPSSASPSSVLESDLEQRLYAAIYQGIVERRLPPGAKLPEQQLSDLFGASRSKVRGVLSKLARDHYLDLVPNRGAFVARPSPQQAREVFAARRLLEAHMVREVARRCSSTSGGLSLLKSHLEREAEAHRRQDHRAAVRLSGEFHLLLAGLAGNAVLLELLETLISRSSLVIAVYGGPTLHACADDEHAVLLEHLSRGDADGAERFMLEHLEHIETSLDLKERGERTLNLRQALRL